MTEFFHYDDLTWPEVAELPRDVPLVLPLGSSFDTSTSLSASPEQVAAQLGHPQRLGAMAPSIPFGWCGSGLAVPEPLLAAYVRNLLDSLRDDGFTRVYAVTPQGIGLGLGEAALYVKK